MTLPPSTTSDASPSPSHGADESRDLLEAVYAAPESPIEPIPDPNRQSFRNRCWLFYLVYNGALVVVTIAFLLLSTMRFVSSHGFDHAFLGLYLFRMLGVVLICAVPANVCFLIALGLIRLGLFGMQAVLGDLETANRFSILPQWACFLSGLGLALIFTWNTLLESATIFLYHPASAL